MTSEAPTEPLPPASWYGQTGSYLASQCIHQRVLWHAQHQPDAVAVWYQGTTWTYAQLAQASQDLAAQLQDNGAAPGHIVGLVMERTPAVLAAMLAVLQVGGVYIPIDPTFPQERIAWMLENAGAQTLLTEASLQPELPEGIAPISLTPLACAPHMTSGAKATALSKSRPLKAAWGASPPLGASFVESGGLSPAGSTGDVKPHIPTPDDLAYIIYTSGSTGKPKGAMVPHRGVVNLVTGLADVMALDASDRMMVLSSLSFDMSVLEIFQPLCMGASLVMVPQEATTSGFALAQMIEQSEATVMIATPTTLRMLLAVDWQPRTGFKILSGGEPITSDLLRALLDRHCQVWNGFGITESTICSTVAALPTPDTSISIGKPLPNVRTYLLDPAQQPVAVGEVGEIYIGGVGVGTRSGYVNQPELTAERFLPDPWDTRPDAWMYRTGDLGRWRADGCIEYLGREDEQCKINGVRVELGEVEAHLRSHPDVAEAAAAVRASQTGKQKLVGYIVPQSGVEPHVLLRNLRTYLCCRLLQAMQPTSYVALPELPRSAAGKVDRRKLPEPPQERPAEAGPYVAPQTPQEEALVQLFEELLEIQPVGTQDEFLWLGGNSLLATRLVARIRTQYQVPLTVRDVFDAATPARLAERLCSLSANASQDLPAPQPQPPGQALPLSPAQQRIWLIHQLDPTRVEYNTPALLEIQGPLAIASLQHAIDATVARHASLRLRFHQAENGLPVQVVESKQVTYMPRVQLDHLPLEQATQKADLFAQEFFRRPFQLAQEPPFRVALVHLSPTQHHLLFVMHHIISDIWSINVLFRDLSYHLKAQSHDDIGDLPVLSVQTPDIAVWQREVWDDDRLAPQLTYWQEQLAGAPAQLALPTHQPRPEVRDVSGEMVAIRLSPSLTEQLRHLGQTEQATLFMPLLAGFSAMFALETGQYDLPIGTLIANRTHPALEDQVGFFANTLVLRVRLTHDTSFRELLHDVRETSLSAYAHPDLPFDRLVQAISPQRGVDQQPLFQVCFVLQEEPPAPVHAGDTTLTLRDVGNGTAPFDLTVQLWEHNGQLEGNFLYRTDVFSSATIERLVGRFQDVLELAVNQPDATIGGLRPNIIESWEQALLRCANVEDVALFPRPTPKGHTEYVAYVVSPHPLNRSALRAALAEVEDISPPPAHFVQVAHIPLNRHGQPDPHALSDIPVVEPEQLEPLAHALQQSDGVCDATLSIIPWRPLPGPGAQGRRPVPLLVREGFRGDATHLWSGAVETLTESAHISPGSSLSYQERDRLRMRSIPTRERSQAQLSLLEGPALVIPEDAPSTLLEALQRAAEQAPEHGILELCEDGSRQHTSYPQLLTDAKRIAAGLQARGLKPGQPVLLQFKRTTDFVTAFWGCMFGGCVPVSLAAPPLYDVDNNHVERLLNVQKLLPQAPAITTPELMEPLQQLTKRRDVPSFQLLSLRALQEHAEAPLPAITANDLSVFLLTSGSTGIPKAVQHHHHTVLGWAESYRQQHNFHSQDIFLNWLPIDHVGGLFMSHVAPVYVAAQQIHAPFQSVLQDSLVWLDWIEKYRVTCSWAPNFAFGLVAGQEQLLAQQQRDLSSWRYVMNAGEMIVPRTARRFLQALEPHGFPPGAMCPAWGMSEIASATTFHMDFSLTTSSPQDTYVSVGRPAAGYSIRIVDQHDQPVPQGEVGHLHIRGPSIMSGYHKRDEINAEVLRDDGWFDTGDLATLDANGLVITGRSKAEIVIRGINIPSHEIETAVEDVPGVQRSFVAACAVRPNDQDTDDIAIFFAHHADTKEALQELCKHIRGAVARRVGATPRFLIPLTAEQIPKTDIGKIQRNKLKDAWEAGEFTEASNVTSTTEASHVSDVTAASQPTDATEASEDALPDWFVHRVWRRRALPVIPSIAAPASLLLFAPTVELGEALRQVWSGQGMKVAVLLPGDSFIELDDLTYQLRPSELSDYQKVSQKLLGILTELSPIIHLWTYQTSLPSVDSTEELWDLQSLGVISLVNLLQSYPTETGAEQAMYLLVGSHRAQVFPEEPIAYPWSPLLGVMATISHELPCVRHRHIDIPALSPSDLAAHLLAEWADLERREPEVAYRNGMRLVVRLETTSWENMAALPSPSSPALLPPGEKGEVRNGFVPLMAGYGDVPVPPSSPALLPPGEKGEELSITDVSESLAPLPQWERGSECSERGEGDHIAPHQVMNIIPTADAGFFLVTGGLGGLGAAVVRDWLQRYGGRFLLVGRTPQDNLTEDRLNKLAELQRQHPDTVTYESVDIADTSSLQMLVESYEAAWQKPLCGVFHLAGVLRDATLRQDTREGFQQALQARVLGAWNVGQLLAARPGAFYVDFSSVSALFGGFGAGSYAAAGRFCEAWSHHLQHQYNTPARSLFWSRWESIGMSDGLPGAELIHRRGFQSIPVYLGLRSLHACLQQHLTPGIIGLDPSNPHIRRYLDTDEVRLEQLNASVQVDQEVAREELQAVLRDAFGTPHQAILWITESAQQTGVEGQPAPRVNGSHSGAESFAAPDDAYEQKIAAIWQELLGVSRVGREDNFFDLGGHSLLLAQAQLRLQQGFAREIPLVELFRHSTVRALATYLQAPTASSTNQDQEQRRQRASRQREHLQRVRATRRRPRHD